MILKFVFVLIVTLAYASGYLLFPKLEKSINRPQLSRKRLIEDVTEIQDQVWAPADERVKVELLYECLCPGCMAEYRTLPNIFDKIGNHIDLYTYPYGNANTHGNKVTCQHGEAECYGNKLHACAIDILKDVAKWIKYNACMTAKRSTDAAADQCGSEQQINSAPIKECAKGPRGQELLIEYDKKTPSHSYVPYVLINGRHVEQKQELLTIICKAFKHPPKNCKSLL